MRNLLKLPNSKVIRSFASRSIVVVLLSSGLLSGTTYAVGVVEAASCARVGQTRTVAGRAQVCAQQGARRVWVSRQKGSRTPVSSGATAASTTTTIKPGLPRSAADRPGNREWDVKFIYATFLDGPDNRRDVNG
ncbi:MAG: hypothetical protein ACKOI3_12115, partial [Actinomycetota bacterium]